MIVIIELIILWKEFVKRCIRERVWIVDCKEKSWKVLLFFFGVGYLGFFSLIDVKVVLYVEDDVDSVWFGSMISIGSREVVLLGMV